MLKKITFPILIISLFLISVNFVLADNYLPGPQPIQPPDVKIKIPGMDNLGEIKPAMCTYDETKTCYQIPWIANYIGGVYKFGVSALALLSVIVIAWGGIVWLTAGGSATQVSKAKDWILGGITGLILGLTSYVLLVTINPDFVNLKPIEVAFIKREEFKLEKGYMGMGCPTEEEKQNGYTALVTAYTKPEPAAFDDWDGDYENERFLCQVGLNCQCPNSDARDTSKSCKGAITWYPCKPFSTLTPYCITTAAGTKPGEGQVAADWSCLGGLDPKTQEVFVCINNKEYRVSDKGGDIKGKRFDIWKDSPYEAKVFGKRELTVKQGRCLK
jgi:3D (Asp-Asp-Asp) domain-containing protein